MSENVITVTMHPAPDDNKKLWFRLGGIKDNGSVSEVEKFQEIFVKAGIAADKVYTSPNDKKTIGLGAVLEDPDQVIVIVRELGEKDIKLNKPAQTIIDQAREILLAGVKKARG